MTNTKHYEDIYQGETNIDWTVIDNVDIIDIVLDGLANTDALFKLHDLIQTGLGMLAVNYRTETTRFGHLADNAELCDIIYAEVS